MVEGRRAGEAHSFGGVAETYDRHRPAPPLEAIEWVLPSRCRLAVDIGSGTGALARRLRQRVPQVVAVEPDPRMLAVLRRRSPEIAAAMAVAERLPLADGSADAAMASSAWHWMDTTRTVAEIARVLRPGGALGVLWNGPDRSVEWVGELLGRRDPSPAEPVTRAGRHHVELPPGAPFRALETRVFTWSGPLAPDEIVGLAGTYSSFIMRPPDERAAEVERIRGVLATDPSLRGRDLIEVPMSSRCWRTFRT